MTIQMDLQCNDPLEFGPEIPFSIAELAKVFWDKTQKIVNVPTKKFLSHCQVSTK